MQNLQSTGQPTWLEMQMVSRSPSGMRTVSTVRPSRQAQQVAARSVGGFEKAVHRGKPDGVPFGEILAHAGGQRGNLHQVRGLAAVKGFVDLAGAVPGLIRAEGGAEISQVHAHKGLRHSLPV